MTTFLAIITLWTVHELLELFMDGFLASGLRHISLMLCIYVICIALVYCGKTATHRVKGPKANQREELNLIKSNPWALVSLIGTVFFCTLLAVLHGTYRDRWPSPEELAKKVETVSETLRLQENPDYQGPEDALLPEVLAQADPDFLPNRKKIADTENFYYKLIAFNKEISLNKNPLLSGYQDWRG